MNLIMTGSWPGYWGSGQTEAEALANLKAAGGRPGKHGTLRFVIDDMYEDPQVDMMGGITARYKGDPDTPHSERPPVLVEGWRYGPRGARKERLK